MPYDPNDPNTWDELDQHEKEFDAADDQDFDEVPAGIYAVEIMKAEAKQSKSGKPMLSLGFQIIEGQHKGRWIWQNFMLTHEVGIKNIKKFVNFLGFKNAGLKDIAVRAADMIGYTLEIQLTYKGDFSNIKAIQMYSEPTGVSNENFQATPPDALSDDHFDGDDPLRSVAVDAAAGDDPFGD